MTHKRRLFGVAGLLTLSLGLVSAPTLAQDANTLTVGFAQEPDTMNSWYSSLAFQQWINDLVQANLWDINDVGEPVPVLVEEIPTVENGGISEDYLSYTITLREGLLWSDGEALNAEDLVFTYEMIEDTANNFGQGGSIADAVESVELVDELTFTLNFGSPQPFSEDMAGSPGLSTILPEHVFGPIYEAEGTIEFAEQNQDPTVFSGAYTLNEWRRGEQMTFAANPNYVLGAPPIENIVLRFFPDTDSQYAALEAGQLDFVPNISEGDIPRVAEFENIEIVTVFGGYIESLWLNIRTEDMPRAGNVALQDVRVRQAIRYGIDRQEITETLLAGATSPTDSIYSSSPFENTELGVTEYDPEAAIALLEEAGWTDSDGDGVRDQNGEPLELRYSTTTAGWRNNIQAVIQGQLAEIGVSVVLEAYPATEFFGSWANNGINAVGEYDIAQFANNTALTNPRNVTVVESLACEQLVGEENQGGQNYTGFCNEEVDELGIVSGSSLDADERLAAANRIQEILRDEVPIITLFPRGDNYAYNSTRFAEPPVLGSGVGNQWFDIMNWQLAE